MTQISSHLKVALLMGLAGLSTSGTATEQIALSPAQKIEVGVVSWVSQQQALKASDLSMQPLDPRLRVPSCSVDLKYDFPFSNAETVRVRCAQPVWQLYVRVTSGGGNPVGAVSGSVRNQPTASVPRQVWVVEQHLTAGSAVAKRQVRLVDKDASSVGAMALDPATDLTYMEAVRDLPPGTVLRQYDLRPTTLVKRGQMVQILIGQGQGFQIAARVEAMQDGRFGEQIKLKNPESGRILSGVVRGRGAVVGS